MTERKKKRKLRKESHLPRMATETGRVSTHDSVAPCMKLAAACKDEHIIYLTSDITFLIFAPIENQTFDNNSNDTRGCWTNTSDYDRDIRHQWDLRVADDKKTRELKKKNTSLNDETLLINTFYNYCRKLFGKAIKWMYLSAVFAWNCSCALAREDRKQKIGTV